MRELKPCPFCSGKSIVVKTAKCGRYIACWDCGCRTEEFETDYAGTARDKAVAAWNRRAQPANEPLIDVCAMLEQAAQDMDDKCRQWQCVLQRVHDAGTFDQNSGLWVGVDKEREAKAQASFEAYRYALGVIDKIAEHVSNPYKFAHKPGGEQE